MSGAGNLRSEIALAVARQAELTARWHRPGDASDERDADGLLALVEQHHRANFDLWHEEDRARDPESSDAEIARGKRAIDRHNQRRNDLVEKIDEQLLAAVSEPSTGTPLHSETPGAMLDRLSILALKLFHTEEEIARPDAGEPHRARNRDRLALLRQQHGDLKGSLMALWDEVIDGRRRFKVYRQMKMYNDPELNPAMYRRGGAAVTAKRDEPLTGTGS